MVPVSIPAVCGGGGEGDGGCGDGEGGGCEDERVVVSVNSGDGALVPVRDSSLDSSPDQVLGPRLSGYLGYELWVWLGWRCFDSSA